MNKIKNKKFIIILSVLITIFIAMIFLVFRNYKSHKKDFYSDGYVFSSSKKLFFNKNSDYKNSLDNKIIFSTDKGEEVKVSNRDFIHYNNKNIGTFKNSYILDLENINDSLINYYVLEDKDIVNFENNIYSLNKYNSSFRQFLIVTDENKFMVVGDNIKLSTIDSNNSSFYEITYKGDKVIIQTEDAEYEYDAALVDVYVNDNIMIDFSTKQVCKYIKNQKSCFYSINNVSNFSNDSGQINDSIVAKENKIHNKNTETNKKTYNNSGVENKNTYEPKIDLLYMKTLYNGLEANLEIIDHNNLLNNDLEVVIVDTETGEYVFKKLYNYKDKFINVTTNDFIPGHDYLINITGTYEFENKEYNKVLFQKGFKTESLNMGIVKDYSSSNEIMLKVDMTDSVVDSFDINYENSSVNKVNSNIGFVNIDKNCHSNNVLDSMKITKVDSVCYIKYTNLESNSNYTFTIDNFNINGRIVSGAYMMKLKTNTLKSQPISNGEVIIDYENGITATYDIKRKSDNDDNIDVDIIDKDNSIIGYKYILYKEDDDILSMIKEFNQDNLKDISLNDDLKKYSKEQNFILKLFAVYNDNEKEVEVELDSSPKFNNENLKLDINFEASNKYYDQVCGILTVKDSSGLKLSDFTLDRKYIGDISTDICFNQLQPLTSYKINIYTNEEKMSSGNFTIETSGIPPINLEWKESKNGTQIIPDYVISNAIIENNDDQNKINNEFNYLKQNLFNATIQIIDENKIVKSKLTLDKNEISDYLFNTDHDNLEDLIINSLKEKNDECNDLYSCLPVGNYTINVTITDKNGIDIPLDNNSKSIQKAKVGEIKVKEINKNGIIEGYSVSVNPINKDSYIYVYDVTQGLIFDDKGNEIPNDHTQNYSILKANDLPENFRFDNEEINKLINYKRGGAYIFGFKDGDYDIVYSQVYYPERITPKVKIYPSYVDDKIVNYKLQINDPDRTLNFSYCGIFVENGNNVALVDESLEYKKLSFQTNGRYRIYYKANVSDALYTTGIKTETLLYDSMDNETNVTFGYDIKKGSTGYQVLLKKGNNINKIVGYKISGDDIIASTDDCQYDSNTYYGCIFENDKYNGQTIKAFCDTGKFGFEETKGKRVVYQEQDSNKYLKIDALNDSLKLIERKDGALGLSFEKALEMSDFDVGSNGVKLDDSYLKPKLVDLITGNKGSVFTASEENYNHNAYINIKKISSALNSINIEYDDIDDKALFLDYYTTEPSIDDINIKNTRPKIECGSNSCKINDLNINKKYYFVLYYQEGNIYKLFNDSKNFKPIVYTSTTNNVDIDVEFPRDEISGSGVDAIRKMNLILSLDEENLDLVKKANICRRDTTNCTSISSFEKKDNSIIGTLEFDYSKENIPFYFGTDYEIQLFNSENIIYKKEVKIQPLKDIEITSVSGIKHVYENDEDKQHSVSYLEINSVYEDLDKILNNNNYQVILAECANKDDDRCSTVVMQKGIKVETETDVGYSKIIFSNVKPGKKYKITYQYSVYQPNFGKDVKKELKTDRYIYINEKSDIISIGNVKHNIDNNYNNTANSSLILSYYDSNKITEINKIVYTMYKDNKIMTKTEENPVFNEYSNCTDGKCSTSYYQNVLNLSEFDLESGKYNLEISYRIDDNEVDRYSGSVEYDSRIYIQKIEDLVELAMLVNGGDSRANYNYVLANDLNFNDEADYYNPNDNSYGDINNNGKIEGLRLELINDNKKNESMGWNPIGTSNNPFSGTFDGNNHTISNLYIYRRFTKYTDGSVGLPPEYENNKPNGLFGNLSFATIKNLSIDKAKIWGLTNSGILAGYSSDSQFINISVNGEVDTIVYGGGIVGQALTERNGMGIINCSSSGIIQSRNYAGGIVGRTSLMQIIKNYSSASVVSSSYSGGIVGYVSNINKIRKNTYNGEISNSSNSSVAGGIIGYGYSSSEVHLDDLQPRFMQNSSSGTIHCSHTEYCGGIAGILNSTITQSFSDINIIINKQGLNKNPAYVGGIVGAFSYVDGPVKPPAQLIKNIKDGKNKFEENIYSGLIKVSGYSDTGAINSLGMLVGINGSNSFVSSPNDLFITDSNGITYLPTTVSKSYSYGNMSGMIANGNGIGLIGTNILGAKQLYNGGIFSEITTGDIGGVIGKNDNTISLDNTYTNNIHAMYSKYSDVQADKELELYYIYQPYTLRNNYGSDSYEISNVKNWLSDNKTKISYEGYDDRTFTSREVIIN